MSKQARIKQSHAAKPPPPRLAPFRYRSAKWAAVSVVVLAIVLAAAVSQSKRPVPTSARVSSGLAPAFSEQDVLSGRPITSASLRGKNVLLFFSEGVMCQACFEQIQSLQQRAGQLRSRGLTLVNVTTDPSDVLRQAVEQYGIKTLMISDQGGVMSSAYGAIGQGMHPNTDGHTFVLLDPSGHIRWRRDYTTMYVPPDQLLASIPDIR